MPSFQHPNIYNVEQPELLAQTLMASYGIKSLQYLVDEMQAAIRVGDSDRANALDRVRLIIEQSVHSGNL
ncbi:hypothetical protein BH09PSE3_BH09PSE3_26010 [soil metagenome]